MSAIDDMLPRIRALLGSAADGAVEGEPTVAVSDVNAVAGMGFRWDGEDAEADVFLFDRYADAEAARTQLLQIVDPEVFQVSSTVNGDLLLWAFAVRTDPTAVARISGLDSSFAGDE